jgi:hypothetical protein
VIQGSVRWKVETAVNEFLEKHQQFTVKELRRFLALCTNRVTIEARRRHVHYLVRTFKPGFRLSLDSSSSLPLRVVEV